MDKSIVSPFFDSRCRQSNVVAYFFVPPCSYRVAWEAEQSEIEEDLTKTNAQLVEVTGVLDQLQSLIFDTFERLGCSQRALEDMLGLNVPINTNNMIVYLGQIEQRANELLNILHYVNLKVSRQEIVDGRLRPERDRH